MEKCFSLFIYFQIIEIYKKVVIVDFHFSYNIARTDQTFSLFSSPYRLKRSPYCEPNFTHPVHLLGGFRRREGFVDFHPSLLNKYEHRSFANEMVYRRWSIRTKLFRKLDTGKHYACYFTFVQVFRNRSEHLLLSTVYRSETELGIGNNAKLFRARF